MLFLCFGPDLSRRSAQALFYWKWITTENGKRHHNHFKWLSFFHFTVIFQFNWLISCVFALSLSFSALVTLIDHSIAITITKQSIQIDYEMFSLVALHFHHSLLRCGRVMLIKLWRWTPESVVGLKSDLSISKQKNQQTNETKNGDAHR